METPSSTTRFTNTIPLSKKFDDSKSKAQPQQDRCALMDMTNDSPIVGLANGGNLDTPSAKQKVSRVKNTPGSGEALLRGQAKTLMQMVQEESLDDGLPSINSSVVHQQQSISQVVNMEEDEKYEIAKSLDFSEKSQGSCVGSCSVDDDASIWSMQVNESNNDDEDDVDEEDDDGDDDEEDYYDADEDGYGCGLGVDELCEGLNKVDVNEKAVPKFAGKHIRFVYDSDDEIVKEEEDESVGDDESNVLRLKGLPTPKGKHLRFSEEEEEEEEEGKSG